MKARRGIVSFASLTAGVLALALTLGTFAPSGIGSVVGQTAFAADAPCPPGTERARNMSLSSLGKTESEVSAGGANEAWKARGAKLLGDVTPAGEVEAAGEGANEAWEARYAASFRGFCVPLIGPEPFFELALRDQQASSIRSAPFATVSARAGLAAARQHSALLRSKVKIPGNKGKAALYGKGPLNFDDPRYVDANATGIVDSTGRVDEFEYYEPRNLLLAAIGTGGVWKSKDLGQSWKPITDRLPTTVISSVAYTPAPGRKGTIIVLTGEHTFGGNAYTGLGAYYSRNMGKTWKRAKGVPSGALGFAVEADPQRPRRIYAATSKGLRRSINAGKTWHDVVLPTGKCAGKYNRKTCNFANMVTDVVVQTPGGSTDSKGKAVIAAVGWRAGMAQNPNGTVQSPGNGLYAAPRGKKGTFKRLEGFDSAVGGAERIGRIEMGTTVGVDQDHEYLYLVLQDAVLFNGGGTVDPLPGGGATGANPSYLNGIYVSPDFGETWTLLSDDQELSDTCLVNQSVYCIPGLIEPGAQSWYNMWITPDPTKQVGGVPSRLLFGLEEVWQSRVNDIPQNTTATSFSVIGAYYGSADCLLVATNCGANREAGTTTTHPDQHAGLIIPTTGGGGEPGVPDGGARLFVGHDGGISQQLADQTDDFDQNAWELEQNNGLQTLLPYSAVWANDGVAWAGLQDNGTMVLNPADDFQQFETYGADGTFVAVDPGNSAYAWESTQNAGLNVTTDGGQSWRAVTNPDGNVRFVNPFVMDPLDPNHLTTGGRSVIETLVGPATGDGAAENDWISVFDLGTAPPLDKPPAPDDPPTPPNQMTAIDTRGPGTYVGFCGPCDILNTPYPFNNGVATNVGSDVIPEAGTSKGWHFAKAKGLPNRFISSVAIDPQDATLETIYVTLGGYSRRWVPPGTAGVPKSNVGKGHVFRSTNAGRTFKNISQKFPDTPALWVEPRGKQLLVGTDTGAYISKSNKPKTAWAPLAGRQLPRVAVTSIQLKPDDPDRALIGTYGRSLWTYEFSSDAPNVPTPPAPAPVEGPPIPDGTGPTPDGVNIAGPFGWETDGEGWTVSSGNPASPWTLGPPGHDSNNSYFVAPYLDLADTTLTSPEFTSKGGRTFVSWWNKYDIEGGGFDEFALEFSPDGTEWASLGVFGGQNFGYPDFSKESVYFTTDKGPFFLRFSFYSDEICSSVPTTVPGVCARPDGYEGAFIDDVLIEH